jgi:hypothetical protein
MVLRLRRPTCPYEHQGSVTGNGCRAFLLFQAIPTTMRRFLAMTAAILLCGFRPDYPFCHRGYAKSVRPPYAVTRPIKLAMLHGRPARLYELDHIVPLLGGAPRDRRNLQLQLWPEAKAKDRDENRLHREVCRGQTRLEDARRQMLRWTARLRREDAGSLLLPQHPHAMLQGNLSIRVDLARLLECRDRHREVVALRHLAIDGAALPHPDLPIV